MAVSKEKAILKKVRKKWISVIANGIFEGRVIGEIPVEDPMTLKNRTISINLMNLTGDIKRQNINIKFLIHEVTESSANAKPILYSLSNGFIKRIVRRDKNKVDDSFSIKTSEGILIRIKPMLITNTKTNRSTRAELLRETRRFLKDHISNTSLNQLINEVVDYNLQKAIRERLHKIFPVKSAEIRILGLETRSKITIDSKLVKLERMKKDAEQEEDQADHSEKSSQNIDQDPEDQPLSESSKDESEVELDTGSDTASDEETDEESTNF